MLSVIGEHKVNSAETIARVLGGKSEDKHEAEKPAEKKKTTRRKSTSKAATKTPHKKTGGRKAIIPKARENRRCQHYRI